MSDRTNAGYTIINAVTIGKGEIVLGERTTANKEKQYVTWECNNGSYYYGHYIENKFDALKDFGQRTSVAALNNKGGKNGYRFPNKNESAFKVV